MTLDFQVTFDAHDPLALSQVWCAVLGYVDPPPPGVTLAPDADPIAGWREFLERAGVPEDQRNSSSALVDPAWKRPRVVLHWVPEGKAAKCWMHCVVRATRDRRGEDRREMLEAECGSLECWGAKRVRRVETEPPLSLGFLVMEDPGSNEFCLD